MMPGIVTIVLNRPEVRNALNREMIRSIMAELEAADRDPTIRAIVLRGEGDFFCAGADLQWMKQSLHVPKRKNHRDATEISHLMEALDHLRKPLIAVVQGGAVGGGAGIVATADIVIAAENAVFSISEVRLGLVPSIIAPYVIAKIGASQARRYFVTGERFSAKMAQSLGLVHNVVPRDHLDAELERILVSIMNAGPNAIIGAKKMVKDLTPRVTPTTIRKTIATVASVRVTPEAQEGMLAFLEKRKPRW